MSENEVSTSKPIRSMKPSTREKLNTKKRDSKQKLKYKRARLIIKNLPFQSTEEDLKECFSKFGEIDEVVLLKNEEGTSKGCGFVQFQLVQKAAKAKHHLDKKRFMGRTIFVDFAMPKDKYIKSKEVPKSTDEVDSVEVKEEQTDDIKEEINSTVNEDEKNNIELSDDSSNEEEQSNDDSNNENLEDEDDENDLKSIVVKEEKKETLSSDINEGKTVFVKNVPFSATNDDLKNVMISYGPIYYAVICVDKLTEHSKGTAFVKFKNKEDVEKVLNAGTELKLLSEVLDCHKALEKQEIQRKTDEKTNNSHNSKDSRNLYLAKEGVILAGSEAAIGISAPDMTKRLQMEQYKAQMLRNMSMFISRERIVVHNLPTTMTEQLLRKIFQKYVKKSSIKETRIMRDLKNLDGSGVGRSKGFAFVTLATHEEALKLLRSLNNNPNTFTANQRPIVTFSIDNRTKVLAKQRRLENSKKKNPTFNKNITSDKQEDTKASNSTNSNIEMGDEANFKGITAKPGITKMRNKFKLKAQAELHGKNLKKQKKQAKLRKTLKIANRRRKQVKQDNPKMPNVSRRRKRAPENDKLSEIVKKLNKTDKSEPAIKKRKWYETK